MGPKPAVLVTRRMPSAVLAQLDAVGEIDLHTGSDDLTREALCARLHREIDATADSSRVRMREAASRACWISARFLM